MLFNTLDFVLFLPLVIICYYLIRPKYRWVLLLTASYYFYMCWKLEYVALIMFSTAIDYFCGIQMGKRESKKRRLPFLILSLASNLGLLFSFKYFNFFSEGVSQFFSVFDVSMGLPVVDLLLPVGISFYTFQTLSYSIDVYQDRQKPEKHLGHFALFVSFFPQLVAGPIERYSSLSPQLKAHHSFNYENLKNGLRLILFGLFTKMVVADNFAPIVDQVYESPEVFDSLSISTAMVFYSFQIYCDFFGYSLIAIGSALIMGIHLMDNFKTPYFAIGIADFWQRWHISLSTWFRDYLYFPLGGNRTKTFRWAISIFIVFLVSGLWHGANVTFLIWGLIFAMFYLLEKAMLKVLPMTKNKSILYRGVLVLKTFFVVTVAWVFFRSESVSDALNLFTSLFENNNIESLEVGNVVWIVFFSFILFDLILFNSRFDKWIEKQIMPLRWLTYGALLFAIIVFAGVENFPFIYFQF